MSDNVVSFPNLSHETRDPRRGIEQEVLDALDAGLGALEDDLIDEFEREAIDNEETFISRFRFDAPREHRRQLVHLKHQADLTDREIRLLRRAGCLQFKHASAEIFAPLYLSLWGWFQLFGLLALMLFAFMAASRIAAPTMMQIAQLVAIEFALLAVAWALLHMYITPRRILNRVQARSGASIQSGGR